MTCQKVVKIH